MMLNFRNLIFEKYYTLDETSELKLNLYSRYRTKNNF